MKLFLKIISIIALVILTGFLLGCGIEMDFNITNWSEDNRNGFFTLSAIMIIFPLLIWGFKIIIDECE